jgi:AraC family transcriptional regulator
MYFTQLPDHNRPDFDEQLHFSRFRKQNIIFNALSTQAGCDNHIGCLSFKTVLNGEEWYGIDGRRIAVRPGQFLILNDDQPYSCRIHGREPARILSVFFKREFARGVFKDTISSEASSLDDPSNTCDTTIGFFQTLYEVDDDLRFQLDAFIAHLDTRSCNSDATDEYLIFFLRHLIRTHRSELTRAATIKALKPATRAEIFKRLCIAKDLLHSCYHDPLDLQTLSRTACLSIPQLVRQFRAAFHTTPHRYLVNLRLGHAARLLANSTLPVREITWQCGFEDASAFCRAFRSAYGAQPETYRKRKQLHPCQPSIS